MSNVIILHGSPSRDEYYDAGYPSESNRNWLPWLQRQLQLADIKADTPEVPYAFEPCWETWCREVERFDIGPDTSLVGHSAGGGFWVRYLSERTELRVATVVLVAPWLDPDGDETDGFFDFTIDPDLAARCRRLVIFNSDNDMGNVHKSVAMLRQRLPAANYREFQKMGHFIREQMGTDTFPELLEELLDGV